ncbi:WD40 repeat-like-containing domain protein [Metarhizium rileyi]|uniref:WD40 repeat-like-containing domain protein n=1 Tax=Metarhizium rileyi (strain RCEF 4871) TaxID=1649241 RepID=A0A167JNU4_METRR|nr:WD40 repeat-like-containing domain protein [Metarhizium rileyi RCEF 4871]
MPEYEKAQNGTSEDAVMLIDSDDEQPLAKTYSAHKFEDQPEFEDEDEQAPYPEIVQTLDLTLGTAVLHVAVMSMTLYNPQDRPNATGALLSDRMVFAASCVTNDVYVITVPLTPPSHESKAREQLRAGLLVAQAGSGVWGESLVLLSGQRKYSNGLAISLVQPKSSDPDSKAPRAVVASCSRQASGTLTLWDVPLDPKAKPDRALEPFQTEHLPRPLSSISFNPSHPTQLLTVSSYQAVRVYDYAVSSIPPDPEATGPFPPQGSWLLSLYQPFSRPTAIRKPILDAAWISHGRAVFALLADGMWGVWDIDGTRQSPGGAAITSKLSHGLRGAAVTVFSISGYVEGTGSLRSVTTQQKENHTGGFAPMTPHTRRQATASLSTANTFDRLAAVRGGVRTITLPPSGKTLPDESLVLWIGGLEHVCVIPGVSSFWDSQLRRGSGGGVNLFSGAQPTRMVKLADLSTGLLGESCCGVTLAVASSRVGVPLEEDGGLPVDVLLQGESRLVVVRQGESGQGNAIGKLVDSRRRRLFLKGEKSNAIIVHGKLDGTTGTNLSFNLSTSKPGTLRRKPPQNIQDESSGLFAGSDDTQQSRNRSHVGFDFMSNLNAAADVKTDVTARNVEAEMLDILEIDQVLDTMEDSRGSRRKKVFFEDNGDVEHGLR